MFYLDIEDANGTKLNDGPITSASGWQYTAAMDQAGRFSFKLPAGDPKSSVVQKKRIVRAWALLGGIWTEVGAGIIDHIERSPDDSGIVTLDVSGGGLLRELTYRSVLNLKLYSGGLPVTHAAAVAAVGAFAPAGWTFTADTAPPNNAIYGYFNGESVLAGIAKIAEKSQNHFYRGAGRNVVFASSFTASGIRAIQGQGVLGSETCAITDLAELTDTYDLITRIYPRGSGNAEVQLTLRATSRVAPAGYVLDTINNYIESTAATATYGRIERQMDFRDIGPISNTDADLQAAANMLFDSALETLRRQSTELEQATYTVALAECGVLLRPMQTIRISYHKPTENLHIEADLNILEATWEVDSSGVQTTGLVVSTADRWRDSDVGTIVDSMGQGQVYQALPQLNANSYTTGYTKNVDSLETAAFRFRFGSEVVQLQQVLFEFQLLPFESTVKSVGGSSSGSGDIPTSGPNVDTTGTGGNNETSSGGTTATDSGGPTESGSSGGGDTGSTAGATGSTTGDTGSTTGDTGTASGSIGLGGSGDTGSGSGAVGSGGPTATGSGSGAVDGTALTSDMGGPDEASSSGGGDTGTSGGQEVSGPSNNSTGSAVGGDWSAGGTGLHAHGIDISPNISGADPVYWDGGGLAVDGVSTTFGTNVVDNHTHTLTDHKHDMANHTHSIAGHTHTVADHTHAVASHTHSVGTHTHAVDAHTHTIGTHTHTITSHTHAVDAHTHSVSSHTHSVSGHTHSVSSHTHTVNAHTHTVSAHTHAIAAHTHSMSQHTHTLNNHIHDLSESISAIYGIFRETAGNTYPIAELEYQVNTGGWLALSVATALAGGWYRLDVTAVVMNATTFRPLAESNLLEIRSAPGDPISSIVGTGTELQINATPPATGSEVGETIRVTGTTQYNGAYIVTSIDAGAYVVAGSYSGTTETTGNVAIAKTVTIDALLSVRNVIQAISYV